nr:thioredoxin domain-containing protein [uncultured Holophaga sp.]
MPNRLAESTSPYLLQHARNPVDWYPWGPEALAKARELDRPIFLSLGYSSCHWCHVMERESFEDIEVAELLNRDFVPVKVDREERPDLDELYMEAVQLMTGRGGWPMSVWLTPDLEPFYGGTYFPRDARGGMPGFVDVLDAVGRVWLEKRSQVEGQGHELLAAMRGRRGSPGVPATGLVETALRNLRQRFDTRWAGFGGAPKFPPIPALQLILARGGERDLDMACRTLDAMAAGGIRDHLGGGFARYSVDAQWKVPHFEKMLCDNAQLAWLYLEAHRVSGEPRYAVVGAEILDYLLEVMRLPEGGFCSAEDADSEGEEGLFYTFTAAEIQEALGRKADVFCLAYGVTREGNFEQGRNILHRLEGGDFDPGELAALRARLRVRRDARPRPFRDDKVLASWNALALLALAKGADVLGRRDLLLAAEACADFMQRELWSSGTLLRTWRKGQAHIPAFLEDYATLILALLELHRVGGGKRWLDWALELGEILLARFQAPEGGFYASEALDLILRQQPVLDHAIPSGNALAVEALMALDRQSERPAFLEAARRTFQRFAADLEEMPHACLGLLKSLGGAELAP